MVLNSKNSNVIFAAMDIPVVHLFNYPELTAFRVHTWRKREINGGYNETTFNPDNILDDEIIKLYSEIAEYYKRISSSEIWTLGTTDGILKLIEYYSELGDFEDSDMALKLCDQVKDLMENLKENTLTNKSSNFIHQNKFDLYLSEISLENNYVYLECDNVSTTFIKLYTINSIATHDSTFCKETKLWLDNLIGKSTALSGSSQKQCISFFRNVINNIDKVRNRIMQQSM